MKSLSALAVTAIAGVVAISATSAQASTFVYTFSGTGDNLRPNSGGGVNFSPDGGSGPDLTVTGFKDFPSLEAGKIDQSGNGLGINGLPSGDNIGSGFRNEEALQLQFAGGAQYTLVSVTYAGIPRFGIRANNANLAVDGGAAITNDLSDGRGTTKTVSYSELGNSFVFSGDDFRIASAQFDDGNAVPEPMTILGTGLALMSMPIMKKARQKG